MPAEENFRAVMRAVAGNVTPSLVLGSNVDEPARLETVNITAALQQDFGDVISRLDRWEDAELVEYDPQYLLEGEQIAWCLLQEIPGGPELYRRLSMPDSLALFGESQQMLSALSFLLR
ncbi:MAG: hypothetical protein JSS87_11000 [Acidobacteria bacterium]|nr:hypothetical protein [Acidobacteriota bacterium]